MTTRARILAVASHRLTPVRESRDLGGHHA